MVMSLLMVYCLAVFAAGLLGGWLPRRFHMTHTRTQLTMSLVAGLMLGVAFFHLIPHAALDGHADIDFAMLWVVAGLVFMLLLLRLFNFHQHDFDPAATPCGHDHSDDHAHHHRHADGETLPTPEASIGTGSYGWVGLLLGLSIHTIVDGIALGAVMRAEPTDSAGILGIGVFMAIFLHKPLDALSIETVMASAGSSPALCHAINLAFALLCPLAALMFWVIADGSTGGGPLLPAALAFSAGAFVCIALGDLLPEIQFHSHDRLKLTLLFLAGIALAWAIGAIEPAHTAGH